MGVRRSFRRQCRILYVWGNDPAGANPRNRKANLENNYLQDKINTWDVGTSTGDRTKQGVHDLAGNVPRMVPGCLEVLQRGRSISRSRPASRR